MTFKTKYGLLLIASLLAISFIYWYSVKLSPAPEVIFKTIKGETIAMADLKGKPVLVTFWASDCPSCIAEIPDLINLHQQYSAQGFTIIAVAVSYDPPNQVLAIANARQLPYPVALDLSAEIALAFGKVALTPTSFFINKKGEIAMKTTGMLDMAALREVLKSH